MVFIANHYRTNKLTANSRIKQDLAVRALKIANLFRDSTLGGIHSQKEASAVLLLWQ